MPASPYIRACAVAGCGAAVARGGYCSDHGRQVDQARGLASDRVHKQLYNSAQWRRTRLAVLAESPFCSCDDCARTKALRPASIVHHRRPHHGDLDLFFDRANLQPLSKPCHDRLTGRGRPQRLHPGLRLRPRFSAARVTLGSDKGV